MTEKICHKRDLEKSLESQERKKSKLEKISFEVSNFIILLLYSFMSFSNVLFLKTSLKIIFSCIL